MGNFWILPLLHSVSGITDYAVSFRSRDSSVSMVNRVLAGRPRNRCSIPGTGRDFSLVHGAQHKSPWRHVYWLVDRKLRLRTANCNTGPNLSLHLTNHQHFTMLQEKSRASSGHRDVICLRKDSFFNFVESVMRAGESYVKL